jgi:hypothetical protein
VTAVTDFEVQFNNGNMVTDLLGNIIFSARTKARFTGSQFYLPEYSVGKRWAVRYQRLREDWPARDVSYDFKVVTRENITVPAGTFDAFRIEGQGWTQSNNGSVSINLQSRYWVAPGTPRYIVFETMNRNSRGSIVASERQELESYTRVASQEDRNK